MNQSDQSDFGESEKRGARSEGVARAGAWTPGVRKDRSNLIKVKAFILVDGVEGDPSNQSDQSDPQIFRRVLAPAARGARADAVTGLCEAGGSWMGVK